MFTRLTLKFIKEKAMRRIHIVLCALFAGICLMKPLTAIALEETQEAKNELRILELLPNLLIPLAIEPGIPEDFVALSPKGALDLYDWTYWGPEDVLKAYFENPASLKSPIIRVKLSSNTAQTGPHSFNGGNDEWLLKMKKEDPAFASIETKWGAYPILAVRTKIEDKLIFMAWVGLNDPSGWTLMLNLVYPEKKGHPTKKDRQLWESLLMKTTPLSHKNYFKACGQDLEEGYTLVNVGGAKLKMVAEKRQSDGMLQVVVIPESPGVEFHYISMMECLMGAEWKYGEPMVKVNGEIAVNNDNIHSTTDYVTSIFYKTVPEFSFKKEEIDEKTHQIFQKNSTKETEKKSAAAT